MEQYEYVLNKTLLIDKELTLTSYKSGYNPNITMNIDLDKCDIAVTFFNITKSLVLNTVNVYPREKKLVSMYYNVSLLTTSRGNISISLSNCTIKNTTSLFNFPTEGKINMFIKNCSIETVFSDPKQPVKSTFHSNDTSTTDKAVSNANININFHHCYFYRVYTHLCIQENCIVFIKGTKFTKSIIFTGTIIRTEISEHSFFLESALIHKSEKPVPGSKLIVQNVTFKGTGVLKVELRPPIPTIQIWIDQCQNVTISHCRFQNSSRGVLFVTNSNVTIKDSSFINNQQLNTFDQRGVVEFLGSSVNISHCHFDNNNAPMSQGGTIRFDDNGRYITQIIISNAIIKGGIQAQSFENVLVSIQASGLLRFNATVNISCPVNYIIAYAYDRVKYPLNFQVYCKQCDSNSYSINSGSISWNSAKSNFDSNNITCAACPYEATCGKRIRSKGNYWGYKTKKDLIKFIYCPALYCCISNSSCLSYNTCYPRRGKRLCGACLKDYSVGLFGTNPCIESSNCSSIYFWIVYSLLIGFYVLFFMYLQEILVSIKKILQKHIGYSQNPATFDTDNEYNERYDTVSVDSDGLPFQLVPIDSPQDFKCSAKMSEFSGVINILFFFYQAASIIRINSPVKAQYLFPKFTDILLSFFNVKIDISSEYIKICPFENSNAIFVEIIRSGILIVCPFILLTKIMICSVYKQTKCYITPVQQIANNEPDSSNVYCIDDNVPIYAKPPFIVRLKNAYIQILLIGFASVSMLSFKLVNCIEIMGKRYLYMQATVQCYTEWQIIIIEIIIVWVCPFWLSLYSSCYLLRDCKITPNEFLFINTFPPITFLFLLRSKIHNHNSWLCIKDAMVAKEFLRVVNQPFRNISGKPFKIQWASVLILRRLLLIIVSTFLTVPFNKLYPMGLLLVLYLIHHMIVQPYKDRVLNIAEGISLAAICFLTLLNTFWAFTDEIDISKNSFFITTGYVFVYTEIMILLCPVLAVFCFSFTVLVKRCFCKSNSHFCKLD